METVIGGKTVRIGGIAKGSGMIHPNMGTMLCFLATDCAISQELLHTALRETADATFNRISVDGDTSTNDSVSCWPTAWPGTPPSPSAAATIRPSGRPCRPFAPCWPKKWPLTARAPGI